MKITTDMACQRARAQKLQEDFPVADAKGLALRVTREGAKTWTLRYRRQSDDKQRRMSLGPYPDVSLKAARERARDACGEISKGHDPAAAKQQRREKPTFKQLAESWLINRKDHGRSASYVYESGQRVKALPSWFLDTKADEIERGQITRVIKQVATARNLKTGANRYQSLISSVLNWGLQTGDVSRPVALRMAKPHKENKRKRHWSEQELAAFWHGVGGVNETEHVKIAMRLVLATGQRPGEITSLKKTDVSLDGSHQQIIIRDPKNGNDHVLPMPKIAADLLREAIRLSKDAVWVFPGRGKKGGSLDPNILSRVVIAERVASGNGTVFGINDCELYDARKTVATMLGDLEEPGEMIKVLLNHKAAKSTDVTAGHYNHSTYVAVKKRLIEMWARHLEAAIGGERAVNNVVGIREAATC